MDVSALTGAEERKLRAARRFGVIGLAITVLWLLLVPASTFLLGGLDVAQAWPLLVLYVVAVALHVWRIREHMRSLGRRAPTWFMVAACVVGLTMVLIGLASGIYGYLWAIGSGILLGDIVGGLKARWTGVWVVTSTIVVLGLGYWVNTGMGYPDPALAWLFAGIAAFYVGTMWIVDVERLWWLKAVTDMDDARRAAAELATARERLRLADDLHDILGHALEVVAFKSELAARLLAVEGQATETLDDAGVVGRARAEMEEVQRVARESLVEVRSLARDTRSTDLVTELAGARAVLGSAGIALLVRGDPADLGPVARNVLGRVLREAMTNVLRHAQPSHCTIEIEAVKQRARLRVVNDGALPAAETDLGTGLVSLSRYLDQHSGRLDAGLAPDGTFQLDAVLPGTVR